MSHPEAQKSKGKRRGEAVVKPVPEQVLCGCGHPVTSRHLEVWDCPVLPEGEVVSVADVHDDAAADELERGLFCRRCGDFIRDEEGEPYEYPDVPELLAAGRLKMGIFTEASEATA